MSITKDQFRIAAIVALLVSGLLAPLHAKSKGGGDHLAKGVELAQQKQYDAAIAEFTKAIEANPKDARGYTNRGFAYRASGKIAEALADFTKAIEVDPKDTIAWTEKARTELMQNQFDLALADASKAVELKPDDAMGYSLRGFAEMACRSGTRRRWISRPRLRKSPTIRRITTGAPGPTGI